MKKSTPESFWQKVAVKSKTECWEWQKATNKAGYGITSYKGQKALSHRVAAYLSKLTPYIHAPKNRNDSGFILHQCDNPKCCNPAHMRVGTMGENQKEAYERGLKVQPKGAAHKNAKQSPESVKEIRQLYREGWTQKALASRYQTSQFAISNIVLLKTYSP